MYIDQALSASRNLRDATIPEIFLGVHSYEAAAAKSFASIGDRESARTRGQLARTQWKNYIHHKHISPQ